MWGTSEGKILLMEIAYKVFANDGMLGLHCYAVKQKLVENTI